MKTKIDVSVKLLNGDTTLIFAIRSRNEDMALLLIEKGADVRVKDSNGWTPLMWAAYKGLEKVCLVLLEKGAK